MLSAYAKMILKGDNFLNRINEIYKELADKKVLIYALGETFIELDKKYQITDKLNVVAISDKKFEEKLVNYKGIKAIIPSEIKNIDYDVILVTNETPSRICMILEDDLGVDFAKITTLFKHKIIDEVLHYNYLVENNFEKNLKKLNKLTKGKSVVIYGAGSLFETAKKYYDLSKLNIIGISDMKFSAHEENEECFTYKVYSLDELKELKPDYILVATKFYINIIENFYYEVFKDTKVKIKALIKKPFLTLWKEIWQ